MAIFHGCWSRRCLSESGLPLSQLLAERQKKFPASGEINRKVSSIAAVLAKIEQRYAPDATSIEKVDGVSIEFPQWRFNLRGSNTEAVLRLNVESRADTLLMQSKTQELLELIDG